MQLIVMSVTGSELARFPLIEGINHIGRKDVDHHSTPEIDLASYDPEVKVSRKHATIEKSGEKLILRDEGSLNGTFLNRGSKLTSNVPQTLRVGDEIIIGKTYLKLIA